MEKRNLDGIYIRVKTDGGKFDNLCLSDCTKEQRGRLINRWEKEALVKTIDHLCEQLQNIGEVFDIKGS